MKDKSLSLIVPALNEEGNIGTVCEELSRAAEKRLKDYEILVFDDASRDKTSEVVKNLQKKNPHIVLIRNHSSQGLGRIYWSGIMRARSKYAMLIPGDNQVVAESLHDIFDAVGTVDVIVTYIKNMEVRPFWRQFVSKVFTGLLNFLFGFKLQYFNGPCVLRTDLARQYVPYTSGYAYMAVMLVKLLKLGARYKQMGFDLQERTYGSTKAFRVKNILSVIKNVTLLYWNVTICRQLKGTSHKGMSVPENGLKNAVVNTNTQTEECNR